MPDTILSEPLSLLPTDGGWALPVRLGSSRPDHSGSPATRPTRHLPERILVAVHEACDLGALDVAADLLRILETVVTSMRQNSPAARRRSMEGLVAAYDRVWHLRRERRVVLDDPFTALR